MSNQVECVHADRTELDDLMENLQGLEIRLDHIDHRLRHFDRWWGKFALAHSNERPEKVYAELVKKRDDVRAELRGLPGQGLDPFHRDRVPEPDADLPPLRERVERAMGALEVLEQLANSQYTTERLGEDPPEVPETDETSHVSAYSKPVEWLGIIGHTSVPHGEDLHDVLRDDVRVDLADARISFKHDVKPIDFAVMLREAAFPFHLGAAPFDGLLAWEVIATLDVPYWMNADQAEITADWIICEQAHHDNHPWNYQFDKKVTGLSAEVNDGQRVEHWSNTKTLGGSFAVEEGSNPFVYIGYSMRIEVTDDGRAGTKRDYGFLRIPGYAGIPGLLQYWYVKI